MKAKKDDGHRMGERCGYTKRPDGSIIPAPIYADEFARLRQQQQGVNNMLKMVSSTATDMLTEIQRRYDKLWEDLASDYGIDFQTNGATYDGTAITVKPKTDKDSGAPQRGEP